MQIHVINYQQAIQLMQNVEHKSQPAQPKQVEGASIVEQIAVINC